MCDALHSSIGHQFAAVLLLDACKGLKWISSTGTGRSLNRKLVTWAGWVRAQWTLHLFQHPAVEASAVMFAEAATVICNLCKVSAPGAFSGSKHVAWLLQAWGGNICFPRRISKLVNSTEHSSQFRLQLHQQSSFMPVSSWLTS